MTEEGGASRRALLGGAATAVAAAALAGCGGTKRAPVVSTTATVPSAQTVLGQAPSAAVATDVGILRTALVLERRTVAAYVAGIPFLSRPDAMSARRFLSQELQHTGQLISLLKAAGATVPDRPDSYALGHPGDADAVLTLLHDLEAQQMAGYVGAMARLSPGPVRAAVATILACDAQQIAILRMALGRPALTGPLLSDTV